MPIKEEEADMPIGINFDDYDCFKQPSSECLITMDIWQKFDIDYILEKAALDFLKETSKPVEEPIKVVPKKKPFTGNHDCMWAGHCASTDHPTTDEPRSSSGCLIPIPPILSNNRPDHMKMVNPRLVSAGQQSLLKSQFKPTTAYINTPPMSDDEEVKVNPVTFFNMLDDELEEEDNDLCDYLEEELDFEDNELEDIEEDEESEYEFEDVIHRQKMSALQSAVSDHSYHKGKTDIMEMAKFGIVTPSDSEEDEEEIDVVNVNEKQLFVDKSVMSLPTNPSNKDRHKIQKRMATAISKKRIPVPQTLKTLAPVKKAAITKRKPAETKAKKTTKKQGKTGQRRRRGTDDSEQEPSEKRTLHNNMERLRRVDLRNLFENLTNLVPPIADKKLSKVKILENAAIYCNKLADEADSMTNYFASLKKRQEFLRRRVSLLRKNLAAQR